MKRLSSRSLAYWGILAIEAANNIPKQIVQKMAFIYKDCHEMLPLPHMGIVLQYTLQQGKPFFFLNIQHGGRASRGGRSPVNRSSAEI
ncbi:hypothetical protein MTR_0031s0050 [Medicago truncatula]|uniref:Uncharacterized protein n=1 Tax=Medicago truncatula TaxID=3880 RepID=A0A072TUH9_MEDTR|nr:hypothetical protein MTR_0031s0050 [Medicago truncatula]